MITGLVIVDLTQEDLERDVDGYLLEELNRLPDGCEVVVNVSGRRYITQRAAALLHEHGHRLIIKIAGTDVRVVADFVRAAREGYWSVDGYWSVGA